MRFFLRTPLSTFSVIVVLLFSCANKLVAGIQNGLRHPVSDTAGVDRISIIPMPLSVRLSEGHLMLPGKLTISSNNNGKEIIFCLRFLAEKFSRAGNNVSLSPATAHNVISLHLITGKSDTALLSEGYRLSVSKKGIIITGNSAAGIFYGIQTLLQLLPPEIESNSVKRQQWKIPLVEIVDRPMVGWRGLMLDVARHFFDKTQVRRFIDNMVKYKFNLLHLHLTDDEGWRLEIKSLPMLSRVGAWRANKVGTFGFFPPPAADEPRNYGGFFTHEDIRELVQYAKERFVDIMPEIDMPGHSLAAIASYPHLSSTGLKYPVNSGEKVMEWPVNEPFFALVDNSLCAAKPEVYEFAEKVFAEVAALFPFEYIHIGGDENAKNFWSGSELISELMKREKLKDLQEVEYYFIRRIEKIVQDKGKKMMGWDEIAGAGLDTTTAIMSYREIQRGIDAARQGHPVVMDPQKKTYLNYQQGDSAIEPPVHSTLLLETVYDFNPMAIGISPARFKGIEGNLWTEQVYTERHLQYMIWPRAFALAEAAWSAKENKNWPGFIRRTETHFKRLEAAGVKYSPSLYDVTLEPFWGTDSLMIRVRTQIPGLDAHYSFDNSYPDACYPSCSEIIAVPPEATLFRVITCRKGKTVGRMTAILVEDLRKRAGQR